MIRLGINWKRRAFQGQVQTSHKGISQESTRIIKAKTLAILFIWDEVANAGYRQDFKGKEWETNITI